MSVAQNQIICRQEHLRGISVEGWSEQEAAPFSALTPALLLRASRSLPLCLCEQVAEKAGEAGSPWERWATGCHPCTRHVERKCLG